MLTILFLEIGAYVLPKAMGRSTISGTMRWNPVFSIGRWLCVTPTKLASSASKAVLTFGQANLTQNGHLDGFSHMLYNIPITWSYFKSIVCVYLDVSLISLERQSIYFIFLGFDKKQSLESISPGLELPLQKFGPAFKRSTVAKRSNFSRMPRKEITTLICELAQIVRGSPALIFNQCLIS